MAALLAAIEELAAIAGVAMPAVGTLGIIGAAASIIWQIGEQKQKRHYFSLFNSCSIPPSPL